MDPSRPAEPLPPTGRGLLGDGGLLAELERWAADARVDEAALERTRERWLRRQAEEEASVTGVLTDLAERGTPLVVATASGRRHRGVVGCLGVDFCAMRTERGQELLIRLGAIRTVRTLPAVRAVTGDRPVTLRLRLTDVLVDLSAERPSVLMLTDSDETARGELRVVGTDVVTIRGDGQPAATIYVPTAAVSEVVFE